MCKSERKSFQLICESFGDLFLQIEQFWNNYQNINSQKKELKRWIHLQTNFIEQGT